MIVGGPSCQDFRGKQGCGAVTLSDMATDEERAAARQANRQAARRAARQAAFELEAERERLVKLGLVPEERPLWDLNDDDKRLLAITAIGGLVANVGLVLVVGIGLAIIRIHPHHSFLVLLLATAFDFGVLAIIVRWTPRVNRYATRRSRKAWSRSPMVVIMRVFIGLACLICAGTVLALVGYAAGIK
jgi:hypothetical protein